MATLEEFRAWYDRDLGRFAPWKRHVQIVQKEPHEPGTRELHIHIFTDKNRYSIMVREPVERIVRGNAPAYYVQMSIAEIEAMMNDSSKILSLEPDGRQVIYEAVKEFDRGYLGCISSSRRWRAGEDWHRGSDLMDGPFDERMWHAIVADMLAYELVEIVKDVREPKLQPIDEYLSTPVPLTDPHIFGGRPML